MDQPYVMNTEGRCGKYIVQTLQPPKLTPEFQAFYDTYAKRLLWMDKNVVPGAFQMNLSWYHSASDTRPLYMHDEHYHDYDEMIGFLGSNPDDPYDLGGEIEVGIDGELHRLTKSSVIFLPAGMKHLPLSILRLERPILHFSISMNGTYTNTRTATGTQAMVEQETRNPDCPCKNVGCENHGLCEPCRERHHARGGLTACERQESST